MKSRLAATFLMFAFVSYLAVYLMFAVAPVSDVFNEAGQLEPAGENAGREKAVYGFIQKYLMDSNGSLKTNIARYEGSEDTLSESIGLIMNYCVLSGKKEQFDREITFLQENMLAGGNLIKWRVGKSKANCNAAIDDLRIVRALMEAYDLWGIKEYRDLAGFIQQDLYEKQVWNGNLCEFYDWASDRSKHSIPLCYLDLHTMDRVGVFNNNWFLTEKRARAVISQGRISEASPFFYKYFNYETGGYSLDEEYKKGGGVCLTYTLYTALHLAEMNEETELLTRWLSREMEKGKLCAWYNPHTLKPANTMESTAVYALAAVYAWRTGEEQLYSQLIEAMMRFMVEDKKSSYFGGFGQPKTKTFYSFDNLTALWALAVGN